MRFAGTKPLDQRRVGQSLQQWLKDHHDPGGLMVAMNLENQETPPSLPSRTLFPSSKCKQRPFSP